MSRLVTAAVLASLMAGCASAPNYADLPRASASDLIGTWSDRVTIETFLPDGTYCSSPASTGAVHSAGTWSANSDGYVGVHVDRSLDPAAIHPDEISELRIVRLPKAGRLLMGAQCFHCDDGLAGSVFRRSWPARTSCAMPAGETP